MQERKNGASGDRDAPLGVLCLKLAAPQLGVEAAVPQQGLVVILFNEVAIKYGIDVLIYACDNSLIYLKSERNFG